MDLNEEEDRSDEDKIIEILRIEGEPQTQTQTQSMRPCHCTITYIYTTNFIPIDTKRKSLSS